MTASANLSAEGPVLAPLAVALQAGPAAAAENMDERLSQVREQLRQAEFGQRNLKEISEQAAAQEGMNAFSNDLQQMELSQGSHAASSGRGAFAQPRESGLSVNYRLPGRVSLASRDDRQLVEIARLTLPSTFRSVATPLLTEYVFREAEVVNASDIALLEGQANVYLAGHYTGTATVPLAARGQKFILGCGIDPELRAWREFVDKKEGLTGGNREVAMTYRLVLDNYKDAPAAVQVFDRIPPSRQDLRVTLESKTPLSVDGEYLRAFRPNGILRWDAEVPAHSAAKTAHVLEYTFKLEFDKNTHLTTGADQQKFRERFKARYKAW